MTCLRFLCVVGAALIWAGCDGTGDDYSVTVDGLVYDETLGQPVEGVTVVMAPPSGWFIEPYEVVAQAVTDADGRYRFSDRGGTGQLPAGIYQVEFDTGSYYSASGQVGFYPEVWVTFEITDAAAHHHVPLLLSPFAYSTYRGS